MTGQLQPLDCKVFGVMKNECRGFLNAQMKKNISEYFKISNENGKVKVSLINKEVPSKPMDRKNAAAYLENSWGRISPAINVFIMRDAITIELLLIYI